MRACVIASNKERASYSYAEALAIAQGFDFYTMREAQHLSMSRYDIFLTADDPNSLGMLYLCNQYPESVFSIVSSSDRDYTVRVIRSVKEGKIAGILTASFEDYNSIKASTPNVIYAPVIFTNLGCSLALYKFPFDDSSWLKAVQKLIEYNTEFVIIPPVESEVLDLFEKFPLKYRICSIDSIDKAIFCSAAVLHGSITGKDRVIEKALSYGKEVIPLLGGDSDTDGFLFNKIKDIKELHKQSNTIASDNIYKAYRDVSNVKSNCPFLSMGLETEKLNRLLVKFPTRGRTEKFLRVLENDYCKKLSRKNDVHFLVSLDDDDDTVNTKVLNAIKKLESKYKVSIEVHVGKSKNKIHAMNRDIGITKFNWDVILIAQDDMIPQYQGWDDIILMSMERYFPDTDGSLWYNDGYVGKRINTLVILGKKYYDRFGYVYHPDYEGMWCDNELTDVGGRLGRQVYMDWCVIKHEHPMNNGSVKMDELYDRYAHCYKTDNDTYTYRATHDYDGVRSDIILSILIPTMTKRRDFRVPLVEKLWKQIKSLRLEGVVEIIVEEDSGEVTIGEKRTGLVRRAHGEYIMFMDDDDDVGDYYIESIMNCLASRDVDVVSFGGIVTMNPVRLFTHSAIYNDYFEKDTVLFRPPNHLNAIRREIAIQIPFIKKSFSEDTDYSMRICKKGLLKTERFIPLPLYIYRPSTDGACSQESVRRMAEEKKEQEPENKPLIKGAGCHTRTEGVKYQEGTKDRKHGRSRHKV